MAASPSSPAPLSRLQAFAALAILSLIWGTSYILIKKALGVYSPFQVGALRLSIATLSFLPFVAYHFRKIDWKRWPYLLLVGLMGTGLPAFLYPLAQQGISSSLAGILNSLSPLFTLLVGILIFRARFVWARLLGVLVGLIGASILVLRAGDVEGRIGYAMFAVVASVCYAISSNTVATYLRDTSSLLISAVSFSMVGIPAALFLFTGTAFVEVLTTHPQGWLGLAYVAVLSLFSTVLASILFFQVIKQTSAVFGSMVAYLVPLVAVGWGLLDGETITLAQIMGMVLILSGVYLSRKGD